MFTYLGERNMCKHFLKLNTDKTEVLTVTVPSTSIHIGDSEIAASDTVSDLGVTFDTIPSILRFMFDQPARRPSISFISITKFTSTSERELLVHWSKLT